MAASGLASSIQSGEVSATASTPASCVVLVSSRAVIDGALSPASIVISPDTGKIIQVYSSILPRSAFPGVTYIDHSPNVLLPGLVDAHVHLNEPGRTEWEGFATGTRAAAFGGVTTVIDMPLNAIPPTTTVANLNEKVAAAEGQCWVDVGFYGGVIPGNSKHLLPLVNAGVRGFKCFLIESGVEEFPAVSSTDVATAMNELAEAPTTLMFHAEMVPSNCEAEPAPTGPLQAYSTFLASRPPSFETCAVDEILSLAHLAPKLPLHIVHLSALEVIPMLHQARAKGVNVTAETCFHYLSLAAENIADGDSRHKCCPPIRSQSNQDALWQELVRPEDSVIKTVVSDHSPCTPELKVLPAHIPGAVTDQTTASIALETKGDFFKAWGGISSVGLGLPILWTEARRRCDSGSGSEISIQDIVRWCCINTAAQVGLQHRKGQLRVGMDADIVVFDDTAGWQVEPSTMLFRNKCSPYQGRTLTGIVTQTWLRGRKIFDRATGFDEAAGPSGVLLLEPRRA